MSHNWAVRGHQVVHGSTGNQIARFTYSTEAEVAAQAVNGMGALLVEIEDLRTENARQALIIANQARALLKGAEFTAGAS